MTSSSNRRGQEIGFVQTARDMIAISMSEEKPKRKGPVTMGTMTKEDWDMITNHATRLYQAGHYNQSIIKCTSHAFVEWLEQLGTTFCIDTREDSKVH